MLIFDGFPNRNAAEGFSQHIQAEYKRDAKVYDSQADSNAVDPFPFRLNPPIVLVERKDDYSDEEEIERSVKNFNGSFAGT